MINADHLSKNYGPVRAVDDISFDIVAGDIVGLLGPNGSGKTTIMRMLTGFFAPTAGTCSVAGVDLVDDSLGARRHIGYLPENIALYPDMNVRGYLTFAARTRDYGGNVKQRVDDVMEECGLAHMARRTIGKMSKGYRQRVGIAQAIVHEPKVLILDEPTVGLDPRQIVEIRSLIGQLAGQSTVLLSTHILPEVSVTCRRVLILDEGRLVAEDTAEGLTKKTVGKREAVLRLRADAAEAARVLGAVDRVESVELTATASDGTVSLLVAAAQATDLVPALVREISERGWPLYEATPRVMSLEELFVKILKDGEGS